MAAQPLPQDTDSNSYDLHPQPTPHAEPGHVHRFVRRGYALECIYCDVEERLILRKENEELKAQNRKNALDWLDLYRRAASKYATLKQVRDFCSERIALSQWQDEQSDDRRS